jgi:tRNA nucleotidyltransferase/poly(A) polymerase
MFSSFMILSLFFFLSVLFDQVDLMPTIGEESYDDPDNRIPTRNQRGTPAQDALRRDLTIGAMFIKVQVLDGDGAVAKGADAGAGAGAGAGRGAGAGAGAGGGALKWTLIDYYGGLADLSERVLRSPYPGNRPPHDIYYEVGE